VLTHTPAHAVSPGSHAHALPAQIIRGPHVVPQAPQLRGSLVVSVHVPPPPAVPPHVFPLGGQVHVPETQRSPPVQSCPHAPQL
jgi:hypothetical protein